MTSLAPQSVFAWSFGIGIVLIERSHPVKHFAIVIIHQPGIVTLAMRPCATMAVVL
jgi:hypothetical protein